MSTTVHDEAASGAEHPGFLQKLKDKLHIGHHKETATHTDAAKSATTEPATHTGAAKSATMEPAPAAPVKEEAATKPEGEHHGGVHTFLADLPDKELPTEETKSHLHHVTPEVHSPKPELDSEEVFSHAQQGEHHGGVPTFMVALPDDEIPKEVTKETAEGTSTEEKEFYDSKEAPPAGNNEFFDSEEVFSKAQEGDQQGVPTFLVALPDQDIQGAEKANLHHVEVPKREPNTATDMVDSEEVFSTPQTGEHHGGVPTFLVALPDEEIPQEVNKGATPVVAGKADVDDRDAAPEEFDSEEVFSKAQQGEHHEGVPTFMVAIPDEDINESKQKLHHVTPNAEEEGSLNK